MTPLRKMAEELEEKLKFSDWRFICAEEVILSAFHRVREEALEEAANTAEELWKNASNEKTDSVFTSYRQNHLAHGCVQSAGAIRSLKKRPTEEK
jgi:hypothetical protein